MPTIGPPELIAILLMVLFIFGAGKLPEVGKALGKGIKEFKEATRDDRRLAAGVDDRIAR